MRKLMLLAGVGALSVSLPVVAKENQGRGRGGGQQAEQSHGGGHGKAERGRGGGNRQVERVRGGGNDRAERGRIGGNGNAERRGRGSDARVTVSRGQEIRAERRRGNEERVRQADRRGNDDRTERRANRDQRRIERALRDERQQVREARQQQRAVRQDVRQAQRLQRRDWNDWSERRLIVAERFGNDFQLFDGRRGRGIGRNGCPPGLARQNAQCMPPGQLRKAQLIGQSLPFSSLGYNVPDRYAYRFVDGDDWYYRYDDEGYVYRFDRGSDLVNSVYPLYGSDLYIGEPLPLGYDVYNVPLAYRPYYADGGDYLYRYDDSAIYQVDSDTMLIEGIVALLTGGVGGLGGLGIGDTLPGGYDVYNVPMDYRDDYVDSDEAWYRYADGSIYEVDPQTRLIEEVISLIA